MIIYSVAYNKLPKCYYKSKNHWHYSIPYKLSTIEIIIPYLSTSNPAKNGIITFGTLYAENISI